MESPNVVAKRGRNKVRKGRPAGPWVTTRKAVQYLVLIIFIGLFIWSQRNGWPGNAVNIPMRLDPLLMLANLLASRTLLTGSALALIALLLTVVFGRAWCGWICPLGTTLDLFPLRHWRGTRPAPAEGWRGVKYTLLLIILLAALFGNLTLLFFDPLTIWFRTMTVSIWPVADRVITAVESALYQVPTLAGPISTFDQWLRPTLLPPSPAFYRDTFLFAGIFLGVIGLNLFAPRFWCRYICPLGGMLGLLSKVAVFRRQVDEECKGCVLCSGICPTGTIDPANGYRSDPGECTLCMDCVETCPRGLNAFKPAISLAEWNRYDPGRREALVAIGAAVAGVALFRNDIFARRESPYLLRPPGARENNSDVVVYTKCIRCSECMRVCPTHAIQPAVFEAGAEGVGSPVLIMRLGFCDYSCNACGQICPVQAIPPLNLDKKRIQVIGEASIDKNRCIPWSDHRPCVVCLEMCPLPKKAVQVEEAEVAGPDGKLVKLQLPHIIRDLCIGCGICEYQCPVSGEAAIRVFSSQANAQF
jgi:polyferredoxin